MSRTRTYYLILVITLVISLGVSAYLFPSLSPLNEEAVNTLVEQEQIVSLEELRTVMEDLQGRGLLGEYLSWSNVSLMIFLACIVGSSLFILLHMLLDKWKFRKFYQEPRLFLALRRAIWLCTAAVCIFVFNLYAAPLYLPALSIVLLLILEVILGWPKREQLISNLQTDSDEVEVQSELSSGVEEENHPQFSYKGVNHDVNELLAIHAYSPVIDFPIAELVWILEQNKIEVGDKLLCQSCSEFVDGWHTQHVQAADVSKMLIITWDQELQRFVVLDGVHRLEKAISEQLSTLKCLLVMESELVS